MLVTLAANPIGVVRGGRDPLATTHGARTPARYRRSRRLPGLAVSEVLGRLYNAGILTSRDELAIVSDLLLGEEATRTVTKAKRRWSEEQYGALEAAYIVSAQLKLDRTRLSMLLQGDLDEQLNHLRSRMAGGIVDVERVQPPPSTGRHLRRTATPPAPVLVAEPEGMTA